MRRLPSGSSHADNHNASDPINGTPDAHRATVAFRSVFNNGMRIQDA